MQEFLQPVLPHFCLGDDDAWTHIRWAFLLLFWLCESLEGSQKPRDDLAALFLF